MGTDDGGLMLSKLSSDKVREATGRGWDEWLEVLDAAGATVRSQRDRRSPQGAPPRDGLVVAPVDRGRLRAGQRNAQAG